MGKIEKIVFGIILALSISAMLLISFASQNKEYKVISNIVTEVLNSHDIRMVYIAPDNCKECDLQVYQMKELIEDYGLAYYYIDLSELYNYKAKQVYEDLNLNVDRSAPTIAIYKGGKLDASLTGITGINRLYNFLDDYGLLNGKELSLNYLTITSYVEKIEQGKQVLALCNYRNDDSNSLEEILWNIAEEYDAEISLIYVSDLSESEGELFESKILNFEDYDLEMPSLLIIDDQKITSAQVGLLTEAEYVEFLEEHDIIS